MAPKTKRERKFRDIREIRWDFLDKDKGTPPFLQMDEPAIRDFLNTFPLTDAQKDSFIQKVIREKTKIKTG